jgi:ABC-type multidrug transport system permease subunit
MRRRTNNLHLTRSRTQLTCAPCMHILLTTSCANSYFISIIIGLVKTAVVAFAMVIVDKRSGRRPMLLMSAAGMAVCMFSMGLNDHLHGGRGPGWANFVFLSLFMASFSLG